MRKTWIYLAGVVVFGVAYAWLKTMISDPVFFVGAIGYLLLLRFVAEKLGR
jgi:hypothetical protein